MYQGSMIAGFWKGREPATQNETPHAFKISLAPSAIHHCRAEADDMHPVLPAYLEDRLFCR
jgi:hypothetical protein